MSLFGDDQPSAHVDPVEPEYSGPSSPNGSSWYEATPPPEVVSPPNGEGTTPKSPIPGLSVQEAEILQKSPKVVQDAVMAAPVENRSSKLREFLAPAPKNGTHKSAIPPTKKDEKPGVNLVALLMWGGLATIVTVGILKMLGGKK